MAGGSKPGSWAVTPETARLLRLARQVVAQTPEVRPEKVASLRKAIAQGTYRLESRKLAGILLARLLLEL